MLKRRLLNTLTFLLCLLVATGAFVPFPDAHAATTRVIAFSGYKWDVRTEAGGPGPNAWSSSNVHVDANGYLHLKITNQGGSWYCAEVTSERYFGFGKYQFQVIGRVDRFDPNIVLGLFNYPTPNVGPDGTNEIDIEFAHWGDPSYPIGNYTVWPAVAGPAQRTRSFNLTLGNPNTTQRFIWSSKRIVFQSLRGFANGNVGQVAAWAFQPSNYLRTIPQHPMHVHFNLWLFQGQPPLNGMPVEIVLKSFKFTPAP